MTTPIWLDEPYAPRTALSGSLDADVAILGGGLTGITAAYLLAARNCRAVVLEREVLASGASGRNAGFLLCGVANTYSVAIKSFGREKARALWAISRDNHALVRKLVESEGLDCAYARHGSHTLALSEQEAKALSRSAKALVEDGFHAEYLDETRVARSFAGGGFLAGLYHPDDGEIHPAHFVRGLAKAAERKGAQIFEGTPVSAIDVKKDGISLAVPGGRVIAAKVLLGTNAYTAMVSPFFKEVITGVRGQMFATEPCPERILTTPVYADFGFEYFRQLLDGRILAGGGRRAALEAERTTMASPSEAVQAAIERFLHSCFPATERLRITHRWGGIMGFSGDELPNVGPVPGAPGVFVAAGYTGHGLGYAMISAQAVTEMMLDGKTGIACDFFLPARHLDSRQGG